MTKLFDRFNKSLDIENPWHVPVICLMVILMALWYFPKVVCEHLANESFVIGALFFWIPIGLVIWAFGYASVH